MTGHPVVHTNLEVDVAHVGHAALRSAGEEAALVPAEGAPRAARPSSSAGVARRRRGNEATGREEALDQVVVQQPANLIPVTYCNCNIYHDASVHAQSHRLDIGARLKWGEQGPCMCQKVELET